MDFTPLIEGPFLKPGFIILTFAVISRIIFFIFSIELKKTKSSTNYRFKLNPGHINCLIVDFTLKKRSPRRSKIYYETVNNTEYVISPLTLRIDLHIFVTG